MQWQPIKTAPVGEDVLLFAADAEDPIVIAHRFPDDDDPDCWYPQHEAVFRGDPYMGLNPTHWMPLPTHPPRLPADGRGLHRELGLTFPAPQIQKS